MDINNPDNTAIDLSIRTSVSLPTTPPDYVNTLVRPIPRLPWTITWYQSAWYNNYMHGNSADLSERFGEHGRRNHHHHHPMEEEEDEEEEEDATFSKTGARSELDITSGLQCEEFSSKCTTVQCHEGSGKKDIDCVELEKMNPTLLAAVFDVACCDGPVVFEKVSNPNFALTVKHSGSSESTTSNIGGGECQNKNKPLEQQRRQLALKTYLCIYCNQSFKSLFCYQKHKKRHLNPVSVDITATHTSAQNNRVQVHSENKSMTKDLNVQFFPCKKCGSKFPSYYFVHKHRKVCHAFDTT
ncbi:uncharacterized protein LOC118436001 [Folsomia candida]|uniref:uncharacterized protein LOC118436001 n=1 Tax=Folsomia candida TaxID=158441 RepID=UPI0016052510|nr:uncharacterized protein LOC118436001 [Folsomia candida]